MSMFSRVREGGGADLARMTTEGGISDEDVTCSAAEVSTHGCTPCLQYGNLGEICLPTKTSSMARG